MKKPFFVMLFINEEVIVPMTNEDDEVCQYSTEEEAREATKDCPLAVAHSYEVFDMYEGL